MTKFFRVGVIVTLIVLLVSFSIGAVSAAQGDNLITDPNFQSIGNSGYWSPSSSGSGVVRFLSDTGPARGNLLLTASSSSTLYGYVKSNDKVNLGNANYLNLTTAKVGSNGINYVSLTCSYSSDGSNWNTLTKTGGVTGSISWDVSSITGMNYIRFGVSIDPSISSGAYYYIDFSGATLTDVTSPPVFSSKTTLSSPIPVGNSTSSTITYTAGVPSGMTVYVNWGDGSTDASSNSTDTYTHQYSSVGYFNVTSFATNTAGLSSNTTTIGLVTVKPKITGVNAYNYNTGVALSMPATITPGTTLLFSASTQGGLASGSPFTWYVQKGSATPTTTAGSNEYTYSFTQSGTYTVKVKVSGASNVGETAYYEVGTVYVGTDTLTTTSTTVTAGNNVVYTWSLNNPTFSGNSYTLQIFPCDSTGITTGGSILDPTVSITTASGTYTWRTTGSTGYYIAKIYKGTDVVTSSTVVNVQTIGSLTVSLTANAVTWTNSTLVTLYQNGVDKYHQTTTTGQTVFNSVVSGTYTVTAETVGYSSQSATVQISTGNLPITIDFVNGASTTDIGGAGTMYSVTYVTFRVIDKNTGATVSGAKISGQAIAATNPIEWVVNWFGGAFGNSVIGTYIEGYSDDNGVVSFVMYPNMRYSLSLNHTGLSHTYTRTFSPSSLSAEYPWYVEFPTSEESTTKNIKVTVNVTDAGLVDAHYKDLTLSTSSVVMNVFTKDDGGGYNVTMGTTTGGGSDVPLSVQLSDYSGKDIKVQITAQTTAYGAVTKNYYHTFIGPWLNLGLPNDIYIWICLLTAILLGGVATFLNSYTTCFVICFFEWMYWFFGWFFQIGQLVALPLLIFATVLSVLFYMQSRK